MNEFPQDYEVFDLGDVTLQHGATLRDAKLAYKTYGELNADKSNAIVYPTWYSGRHWDNEWLIGDGMALDPDKVQRACPFCGSSKTSEHNVVFLEGVKSALTADAAFKEGWYTENSTKGLRAAARVY